MLESPVVSVHIPPSLRPWTGGHEEIMASGETVAEILASVGNEYPSVLAHLMSAEGTLRPGLSIYLGANCVRDLDGLATPVRLEELVSIVADAAVFL